MSIASRFQRIAMAIVASFEARAISPALLPQAHAVLQLGSPEVSLADCRVLCARGRSARSRGGALMGIFDRRGYIHAVFRVRTEPVLPRGQRMKVYDLVLSDMIAEALFSSLIESLECFAREEACDSLTVATPLGPATDRAHLADMLRSRGFSDHRLLLERRM
jgi:hypothetical protein